MCGLFDGCDVSLQPMPTIIIATTTVEGSAINSIPEQKIQLLYSMVSGGFIPELWLTFMSFNVQSRVICELRLVHAILLRNQYD